MLRDANDSSFNATNGPPTCTVMNELAGAKAGKIFASCAMLVLAIVGNSFIALVVYRNKKMRKTIHYFVVNMACSDLIFPIFVLPRIITEQILGHQVWLIDGAMGLTLCKLVYFFQDISTAVSIQSLVLIAVDRFWAVVFPVRLPLFNNRLCRILTAATWMFAMVLHSPYLVIRQLIKSGDGLKCYVDWKRAFWSVASYKSYIISLFSLLVVIPFALLVVLYSIIISKVKHQPIPLSASVTRRERRRRYQQERNILKMALAIVIGFGVCMAPLNVYIFLFLFLWQGMTCSIQVFRAVAFFFFYANCAINPCICFFFSEGYRNGLKSLLKCGACRCKFAACPLRVHGRQPWILETKAKREEVTKGRRSVHMSLLNSTPDQNRKRKQSLGMQPTCKAETVEVVETGSTTGSKNI